MQPLGNIGRNRVELARKVTAFFDDPSSGGMEPMVIPRGEVHNREEEFVANFDVVDRAPTRAPREGWTTRGISAYLECNGYALRYTCRVLHTRILRPPHRRVDTGGRSSRAATIRVVKVLFHICTGGRYIARSEQLVNAVLDSVDVGKFRVLDNRVISVYELNLEGLFGAVGREPQERV